MKSLILLPVIFGAAAASAQLRTTGTSSNADHMRSTRKMMEAQTELTVLEKLEESRINDERLRREKFEDINFNMVQDPYASKTTQNSGYGY